MGSAAIILSLLSVTIANSCSSFPLLSSGAASPPGGWRPEWRQIALGIDLATFSRSSPPLRIWALRVSPQTPGLEAIVTPASQPDTSPPRGKTIGHSVSAFAREFGCVAAINASPFYPSSANEGEARSIVGLSISGGRLVSPPDPRFAALVSKDGIASIRMQETGMEREGDDWAVGGFGILLRAGDVVGSAGPREPRTAVGLADQGRTLFVLVADGRQAASLGLTEEETGAWLAALGAVDGLELDGGGSTALALDPEGTGSPRLANRPVHGGIVGQERVVGNCLGFRIR